MKDLWTYPVSFPYGATSSPYSKTNPHKGEDRAAPTGTPIPVNGHVIGEVGNTGYSFGSHCHVGKWKGGVSHNPNGGGETLADTAVVTQVDTVGKTNNGKFVRVNAGGYDWVYLHLSKVNVKVGDKLKKKEDFVIEEQRPVFLASYYLKMNPDVAKKYTVKTAINHWKKYGIKEGRPSAPNFHVREYVNNYSDLKRIYGKNYPDAVKHYFNFGINEGRSGRKRNPVVNTAQATLDKIKALLGGK